MPVYELADWAALQEQIKAGGQAVSGLTAAEAQAALNAQAVSTQGGSNLYVYNPANVPASQPPIQFPGTTASQASADFVTAGGATNAAGAAVSGAVVSQSSNIALTQGASGATGVAGVLSMNLPTAAAAIAPLAGVALGVGLYELSPDFWEQVSRALLPFCYDDTNLISVVVDENGKTYYPEGAINAVRRVVQNVVVSEIGGNSEEYSSKISPYPFKYMTGLRFIEARYGPNLAFSTTFYISDTAVKVVPIESTWGDTQPSGEVIYKTGGTLVFASLNSFTISGASPNYKYKAVNGKLYYYYSYIFHGIATTEGVTGAELEIKPTIEYLKNPNPTSQNPGIVVNPEDIAFMLCYNEIESYPDGVEKWRGAKYPTDKEPMKVITSIGADGALTTEPYYPITTPVGDPGVTVDPNEFPDLTDNPDPKPAIDPWITTNPDKTTYPPYVVPSNPSALPGQLPDYTPILNPNEDPSKRPAEDPLPEEKEDKKDKDSGDSPKPQIPLIPTLPSAASGLLHVYNPNQAEIDSFGSWLWSTFSGDLIDTLSKLFNDPMDAVIGLHELYATPAITGRATIRAGFLDSGVGANLVGERYTTINCGSVVVPEYYQNYLDYSPYTKCFIYLPFVGIVPVSADDIIGNAVNITYNVDAYNGCCIAIVTVARAGYSSTVYQFEGNCGVEIPITSGYQSVLMGGLLGIAGTAITGSPHVGLAAASLGRANLGKNEVSHSGSFGSSYGAMGAKIPYIIVKRPTQKSVVNYNEEYGFPAHKRVKIGDCKGYLRAREIHVISPTATDDEKARIEGLLKEGVFVQ